MNNLLSFEPVCKPVCVWAKYVQLFATLWTIAHQAPLPMKFSRQEYWSGCHALSRVSPRPRDQAHISYISCIGRRVLYH